MTKPKRMTPNLPAWRKCLYNRYARVSTEKQSRENLSLDEQFRRMQVCANQIGIRLHETPYMDEASAFGPGSRERPGYQALIRECIRLKTGILVTRVDRLSRDVAAIQVILDNYIPVWSVDDGYVNRKKLVRLVREAQAESERNSRDRKAAARSGSQRQVGLSADQRRRGTIANSVRRDDKVRAVANYLELHPEVLALPRAGIIRALNDAGILNILSSNKSDLWTPRTLQWVWRRVLAELGLRKEVEEEGDKLP